MLVITTPEHHSIEFLLSNMGFEFELVGCRTNMIGGVAEINKATQNDLSFCSDDGQEAISTILNSNAGIILCRKSLRGFVSPSRPEQQLLVFLDNPRLAFMRLVNQLHNRNKRPSGISPHSVISKTASIGSNCFIGDYTIIGDNCKIGDNTVVNGRVTILENCTIGNNCTIQPGVSIGADGFGFERISPSFELEKFPHLAGVRIGDNVEICANCSIARGCLSDTIIGNGTKLDALVHIAHNVVIGENCELTAGTIIGGSTVMGDSCWTGLNSTLKHKIKIGDHVIIGAGASVINHVPSGDIVAGVPAKSIKHKVNTDQLFLMAGQNK
jgi:UDP-3-O-[3-hydroxymyristoyl] glucosamine N-acyltransferase